MLDVKELTVAYGRSTVLSKVSLHLVAGEKCALLGANGAGKTTLFRALTGVIPSSGTVRVGEILLSEKTLGELRRDVGLVFQNPDDQLFMPTVGADVAFGLQNQGLSQQECEKCSREMLKQLGIEDLEERSALGLSGGEKRLAALAAVLVMKPKVLLLDEPTAFLDAGARRRLLEILTVLPQTMLIATHDLSFALALCSRAVLLARGVVQADGICRELLYDREIMEKAGVEDIRTFYGGIL